MAGDLSHGVVEGQVQDFDAEVDGIAREVALGPPPVAVLDDQTRIVRHGVISRFTFLEPESPPLEQREDRSHPSWHKFNREWTRIDANAEKAPGL